MVKRNNLLINIVKQFIIFLQETITPLFQSRNLTYPLNKFNNQCENVQFQIEVKKEMIENAKEARDRLLPKLMSGEIEV